MKKTGTTKLEVRWTRISTFAILLMLLAVMAIPAKAQVSLPTLTTDKFDYAPEEVVHISGTGFMPGVRYAIPVQRPDGSIITIEDHVATYGWDVVTADEFGNLSYDYQLDGILGVYEVRAYLDPWVTSWDDLSVDPVAAILFTDAGLTLVKSATTDTLVTPGEYSFDFAGDLITYTYQITNTTSGSLAGPFSIADDKFVSPPCTISGPLAAGASASCSASYTSTAAEFLNGLITNTASASGSGASSLNDQETVTVPLECRNDTEGADDEAGQKDLTKLCRGVDTDDPEVITFNWDIISQSGNNTADACALFDTDNDGYVNYSLCVVWQKQRAQLVDSPRLYQCADNRSDRCQGSTLLPISNGSYCVVDLAADDPFSNGTTEEDLYDAKAYCSIQLEDVGGVDVANLLDVCSYPSSQPNSDPSDCVIISANAGNLVINKDVVPDDAATNWVMTVTGNTPFTTTLTGDDTTGLETVMPGTYTITETAGANTSLADYTTTWACTADGVPTISGSGTSITGVSMVKGSVVVCSFTNTKKPSNGTLIVQKIVVNDNGGTLEADDFSFVVNGGTAVPFEADGQNQLVLPAGTYTVTESAVAGYSTLYSNCDGIVLDAGETETCVITNNDLAAGLTVVKTLINDNGGSKVCSDFSFTVNGGTAIPFEADCSNTLSVAAGTYTVVEVGLPISGYDTSYNNCSSVVVANGGSATCTITNNDKAAGLTVVKTLVNDNGGSKVCSDFSFTVNGGTAIPFEADCSNTLSVAAGTYTVVEVGLPISGYDTSYNNCSSVVVANGGSATCTITNNDQAAGLTVVKTLVNDNGGSKVCSDFSFTVNGGTAIPFEADCSNTLSVAAGTYTVVEVGLPISGYDTSYNNCSSVVVANGGSATCTITNNDQAAGLTVVKTLVNDNGGSKVCSDFSFTVNGGTAIPFEADCSNTLSVAAGTYTVVEVGLPISGYDTSYNNCSSVVVANGGSATCTITNNDLAAGLTVVKTLVNDNGGSKVCSDFSFTVNGGTAIPFEADCSNTLSVAAGTYTVVEVGLPISGYDTSYNNCSSVVVANGGSATCTITNNDQAAGLTVVKTLVNDNGGSKVCSDFSFTVNGGTAIPFEADCSNTLSVAAGTYTVVEVGLPISGYDTSYNNCSSVVVANGGSATCTITNNDQAAGLTVVKTLVNDNGGSKVCSDFSFTVNGGTAIPFEADCSNTLSVAAGTYTVVEVGLPISGYDTSYNNCSSVVVANGGSATCTITNNDQAAGLTVVKTLVNDNGGSKVCSDFSFTVNGGTAIPFEADCSNTLSVAAGTYTVVEVGLPISGYDTSYNNCSSVVVANGGSATCTITNNDQAAGLTVVKTLVNDNGGSKVCSDFSFTVNGGTAIPFEADCSNTLSVAAGTYTVVEVGLPISGYDTSYNNCSSVVVANGGSATCTITNNDQAAGLTVVKTLVNDNGGSKVCSDFSFTVNGGTAIPFEADCSNTLSVAAGTYTVVEVGLPISGYDTSYNNCSSVVVANGGSATCTITNNDQAAGLTVVKTLVNDNGGSKVCSDFSFTVNGGTAIPFEADCSNTLSVAAGTYTVVEVGLPISGYDTSYNACSSVVIASGGSATCTITNDDVAGSLEVTKIVDWAMAIYEPEKIFTICVQGPTFPLGTEDGACKTVGADGGVLLWENLLPGSYIVTEENPGGEWMVIYVGTPAEVVAGGLAQASITNKNTAITAVTLKYFVKEWVIGMEAKLAWATVVEVDNLGFEIYRSDSNDFQTAEKIGFVASQVQTGDGRIYGFLDSSAPVQGQYYYWLVDISNSGQETVEGDPLNGLAVRLYASVYFLPGVSK